MLSKKTLGKIRAYFKKQPDVVAVYLYGSQARSEADKDSDIDLAVLLDEEKGKKLPSSWGGRQVHFMNDLIGLLNQQMEIQDLSAVAISFVYRVLSEGKLLYCKNDSERVKFETRVLNQYFDLKPFYQEYYQILGERARKGLIGQPAVLRT